MESASIISIYLYGSAIYGLMGPKSDYDVIVIVDRKDDVHLKSKVVALTLDAMQSYFKKVDVNIYTEEEFLTALEGMEISFLECTNDTRFNSNLGTILYGKKHVHPAINLEKLRHSISQKASNSWVKAKKKMIVESPDFAPYIGKKSAWHSLRILMFGTQLAKHGRIVDVAEANSIYQDVMACETWEELNEKFHPLYNHLSTEFRKVAPK